MKKIYNTLSIIGLSLVSISLNAQVVELKDVSAPKSDSGIIPHQGIVKSGDQQTLAGTSTFSTYYDRATSFEVPEYPISSTQSFYYLASVGSAGLVGVDYDNTGTVAIDEFLVLFAGKIQKTGTRVFDAHLYNADASGLPTGSAVGSTTYSFSSVNAPLNPDSAKIGSFNNTHAFTSIKFSSPVNVTGDFVAVVEIDDTNHAGNYDGDVLYMYTNNCYGDGKNEKRMCHYPVPNASKIGGGTVPAGWYKAGTFWTTVSYLFTKVFDCDAIIIPIVVGESHALGNNEVLGRSNELTFNGHYPSPANEQIKINYELMNSNEIMNVKVFDISGRVVYEKNHINQLAGKYTEEVPVSGLASGTYYYSLKSDNGNITSKFVVTH